MYTTLNAIYAIYTGQDWRREAARQGARLALVLALLRRYHLLSYGTGFEFLVFFISRFFICCMALFFHYSRSHIERVCSARVSY